MIRSVIALFFVISFFLTGCVDESSTNRSYQVQKNSVPVVPNNQIQITQQLSPPGLVGYSRYGSSLSMDGSYLATGAEYGTGTAQYAGAVYMYKADASGQYQYVDTLIGSGSKRWHYFGADVSVSGDYVAVGAYLEGTVQRDEYAPDNTYITSTHFAGSGVAYVYKNDGNDNYAEIAKIELASEKRTKYGMFGRSISMEQDYILIGSEYANTNIVVGGYYVDNNYGAAFIFKNNGSDTFIDTARLVASDGQRDSQFGHSVALEGQYAVVGAPRMDDQSVVDVGAAYVFKNDGNDNYTQIAKLMSSTSAKDDFFGASVAISGNYIAVGAYGDSEIDIGNGAVYIFKNSGNDTYVEIAKITVADAFKRDWLGYSVDIDGQYVVAGALYADDGIKENCGATYVFKNDGTDSYIQIAKLVGYDELDYFGNSVGIKGDKVAIGALFDDVVPTDSGAFYTADLNSTASLHYLNYTQNINLPEDTSVDVVAVNAVSTDAPISYSLSGDDSTLFGIDSAGVIAFNTTPDFENPQDLNGDNMYQLTVTLVDQNSVPYVYDHTVTIRDIVRVEFNHQTPSASNLVSSSPDKHVSADGDYSIYRGEIFKKDTNDNYTSIYQTGLGGGASDISGDYFAVAEEFFLLSSYQSNLAQNRRVYIYKKDINDNISLVQTIISDFDGNVSQTKYFGYSVSLDGDYLGIVSYAEKSLYIFKKNSSGQFVKLQKITSATSYKQIKNKVEVSGGTFFTKVQSSMYVFANDGFDNYPSDTNSPTQVISSYVNGSYRSSFGSHDYSADGDYLAVSAAYESRGGISSAGLVFIFKRDSVTGDYLYSSEIGANTYSSGDLFGEQIEMNGNYIAVTASWARLGDIEYAGRAFFFKRQSGDTFSFMTSIQSNIVQRYDFFGRRLAMGGDTIIVLNAPSLYTTTYRGYYYDILE